MPQPFLGGQSTQGLSIKKMNSRKTNKNKKCVQKKHGNPEVASRVPVFGTREGTDGKQQSGTGRGVALLEIASDSIISVS